MPKRRRSGGAQSRPKSDRLPPAARSRRPSPSPVLMADFLQRHLRQAHGLKPAQHAQLGVGIAQAIENHDAQQRLEVDAVAARSAKDLPESIQAERFPKLGERPDVAQSAREESKLAVPSLCAADGSLPSRRDRPSCIDLTDSPIWSSRPSVATVRCLGRPSSSQYASTSCT